MFTYADICWRTFFVVSCIFCYCECAAVNTCVQVFVRAPVFSATGCIPRSGIAGSSGNFTLDFLRNLVALLSGVGLTSL